MVTEGYQDGEVQMILYLTLLEIVGFARRERRSPECAREVQLAPVNARWRSCCRRMTLPTNGIPSVYRGMKASVSSEYRVSLCSDTPVRNFFRTDRSRQKKCNCERLI